MAESPFGGGGGKSAGNSYNPPAEFTNIFNQLNYKRYLIDPSGVAIEIAFDLQNKKVAIKTGEDINIFDYIPL